MSYFCFLCKVNTKRNWEAMEYSKGTLKQESIIWENIQANHSYVTYSCQHYSYVLQLGTKDRLEGLQNTNYWLWITLWKVRIFSLVYQNRHGSWYKPRPRIAGRLMRGHDLLTSGYHHHWTLCFLVFDFSRLVNLL